MFPPIESNTSRKQDQGHLSCLDHPEDATFGELLIDPEEDKAARALVFGLLAEMERK